MGARRMLTGAKRVLDDGYGQADNEFDVGRRGRDRPAAGCGRARRGGRRTRARSTAAPATVLHRPDQRQGSRGARLPHDRGRAGDGGAADRKAAPRRPGRGGAGGARSTPSEQRAARQRRVGASSRANSSARKSGWRRCRGNTTTASPSGWAAKRNYQKYLDRVAELQGAGRAQRRRTSRRSSANSPSCHPSIESHMNPGESAAGGPGGDPRWSTRWAEAFDLLATMVAVVRPDGHCLFANAALRERAGPVAAQRRQARLVRLVRRGRTCCAIPWPRWHATSSPPAASMRSCGDRSVAMPSRCRCT